MTRRSASTAVLPLVMFVAASCSSGGGGGGGGGGTGDGPAAILPNTPSGAGVAGDLDGIWRVSSLTVAMDPPPSGNQDINFFENGADLTFAQGTLVANRGQPVSAVEPPREATTWQSTRDFFVNASANGVLSYALGETIRSDLFDLGRVRIGLVAGTTDANHAIGKLATTITIDGWKGTDPNPTGAVSWDMTLVNTGVRPFGVEYGGTGGDAFTDQATDEPVTEIVLRAGSFIDAVQFRWANHDGGRHGGGGGDEFHLTLDADEYVTGLSGEYGQFVEKLAIVTNKRTMGPYGGTIGTGPWQRRPFSILAAPGAEICGARGAADSFLDRLGVLVRDR